jgi:hypothetical protein
LNAIAAHDSAWMINLWHFGLMRQGILGTLQRIVEKPFKSPLMSGNSLHESFQVAYAAKRLVD